MIIEESKCFLPYKIEDLTKFVLVGREKLNSVRSEIRAIDKVGLAKEVREQKREEANYLADALLDAETRLGELLKEIPKASGNYSEINHVDNSTSKQETVKEMGFSNKQVSQFQRLADNKEIVEQVKAEAKENDDLPTRTEVLRRIKERDREAERGAREYEFKKTYSPPSLELETFLAENYELIDNMLKSGLFYPARDVIINDAYSKLLSNGVKSYEAMEQLSITYNYSIDTIKKIVYQK